jgi:hypothetical protein
MPRPPLSSSALLQARFVRIVKDAAKPLLPGNRSRFERVDAPLRDEPGEPRSRLSQPRRPPRAARVRLGRRRVGAG